jgi:hypothetical protein
MSSITEISGVKITVFGQASLDLHLNVASVDFPPPSVSFTQIVPITVLSSVIHQSFCSPVHFSPPAYSKSILTCAHIHPLSDEIEKTLSEIKDRGSSNAVVAVDSMIATVSKCADLFNEQSFPTDPAAAEMSKKQATADLAILDRLLAWKSQHSSS